MGCALPITILVLTSLAGLIAMIVISIVKARWISTDELFARGLPWAVRTSLGALRGWPAWVIFGTFLSVVLLAIAVEICASD